MIHVSPSRGVPSISPQKGKKKTEKLRLQAPTSLPSAPNPRPSASPAMSGLRAISTLLHTCAAAAAGGSSRRVALAPPLGRSFRVPWRAPSAFVFDEVARAAGGERRRVSTRAASWDSEKSPYETLGMMTLLPPPAGESEWICSWNQDWYLGILLCGSVEHYRFCYHCL